MASAKLVLRLDDACPTQRRNAWSTVETLLTQHGIRPIVGVIPDCRDSSLIYDADDEGFWPRVRRWRDDGWTIALHGETHVYRPLPDGARSLVPFHRRGEYVGRPLEDQRASIRRSWERFQAEGLRPTMFMAPAHGFDESTIEALKLETDIRWLTDGISWRPFRRRGFNWLPQQLFRVRRPPPRGIWTVCLHPNSMTDKELGDFAAGLERCGRYFVDPSELIAADPPRHGPFDGLFAAAYWRIAALKWKTSPD